jgi:hypothetical protein
VTSRRVLAALLSAALLWGCGDSDDGAPEPEPDPGPPPRETVDRLPNLPESWRPFIDRRGGIAVGLPRGWKAKSPGDNALVRSYDHLVAISIAPERGAAAQDLALEDFAARTAEALPGLREGLRRVRTRRYRHPYEGVEIRGRATARGGVDQLISVIVLRRDRVATVTAVIAANAKPAAQRTVRLARRVVASLRTRPPRTGDTQQ